MRSKGVLLTLSVMLTCLVLALLGYAAVLTSDKNGACLMYFPTTSDWTAKIRARGYSSYAVDRSGTLWVWGDNSYGQLGIGNTVDQLRPFRTNITNVKFLATGTGGNHVLFIRNDGTLWGVGWNFYGQLGVGDTLDRTTPVQVPGLSEVLDVSAGLTRSVAIASDGSIYSWGGNSDCQLGIGVLGGAFHTPRKLQGYSRPRFTAVSVGTSSSYGIGEDGSVWAWGDNEFGQLGLGTTSDALFPSRVNLNAIKLGVGKCGARHMLFIKNDGTLWSVGRNSHGQLGVGNISDRSTPVQVLGLSGVVEAAAGYVHSVALTSDGSVYTWGGNYYGQLGLGDTSTRMVPVRVNLPYRIVNISSGTHYVLAVASDGSVWAWGLNSDGQLGIGNTTNQYSPVKVLLPSSEKITTVVASCKPGSRGFALSESGKVYGWGYGFGTTPVEVGGFNGRVVKLYEGANGAVAVTENGAVYRIDSPSSLSRLTDIEALNPVEIVEGESHTLIISANGKSYALGSNSDGRLGIAAGSGSVGQPFEIVSYSPDKAVDVECGNSHCIALGTDGKLYAWGYNANYQLGTGDTLTRCLPTEVTSLPRVAIKSIAASNNGSFILTDDGQVYGWGSDAQSQTPRAITGFDAPVAKLSGATYKLYAVTNAGSIYEYSRSGGLKIIPGYTGIYAVGGYGHTLFISTDGKLYGMGYNYDGQLGTGDRTDRSTPVEIAIPDL